MSKQHPAGPPSALVRGLTQVLRPLIRLLVRHHITFPYLSQMLKVLYLDVALKDFPAPANRQTDSRLSMLTGVHRKDVRKLREELAAEVPAPNRAASLGAQVVAAWLSLPDYVEDDGKPKALPRFASPGEPSFEELVANISRGDVRARSLLDEWLRAGLVEMDAQERVHLRQHAFVPAADFEQKVFFFARNNHDHLAASIHNLLDETPACFDRSVYYNNLSEESVAKLRALLDEEGMALLKKVNRKARELQRRDATRQAARYRFNLGIYLYSEPQKAEGKAQDEQP
jgi:hypothetical protein